MAYLLYSISFLAFVLGTALYLTRSQWLPAFTDLFERFAYTSSSLYSRLPGTSNSFEGDIEAGLSSSNFDLATNLDAGDSRAGLDDAAKREILRIMKRRRLTFDKARAAYMEQRFRENGIGADGRPRDPKFVSFS